MARGSLFLAVAATISSSRAGSCSQVQLFILPSTETRRLVARPPSITLAFSSLYSPLGQKGSEQGQSQGLYPMAFAGSERESKKAAIDTSGIPGPSTSSFRPPPGFMDAEDPKKQAAFSPYDPQEAREAMDKIRAQAGHWHELAKLFPRLAAAGYDSQVVEMETGLERKVQNAWMTAQHVCPSAIPWTPPPSPLFPRCHCSQDSMGPSVFGNYIRGSLSKSLTYK